jgi:hypothetical protein
VYTQFVGTKQIEGSATYFEPSCLPSCYGDLAQPGDGHSLVKCGPALMGRLLGFVETSGT